jgi:hypothetical protein
MISHQGIAGAPPRCAGTVQREKPMRTLLFLLLVAVLIIAVVWTVAPYAVVMLDAAGTDVVGISFSPPFVAEQAH